MIDANETLEGEEGPEGTGGKRRLPGKKLVLLYILPALLLFGGGGGAGAWFFLFQPGSEIGASAAAGEDDGEGKSKPTDPSELVFYDLPQILVNLNSGGKRNSYLKIALALEFDKGTDMTMVQAVLPRIMDNFQIYLRELRIEDLNGSAGPMMLKEELLMRLNASTGVPKVNDILFREILIQ